MKNKIKYVIGIIICLVIVLFGGNKLLEQETVDNTDNKKNDSYALVNTSESEDNLKIYFIDQTTPNMIQGLKGIFERNALISRGYSLF